MSNLVSIPTSSWDASFTAENQAASTADLETGNILFLPELAFSLTTEEQQFLSPTCVNTNSKNISYQPKNQTMKGNNCTGEQAIALKQLLARYSRQSTDLIHALLPHYKNNVTLGRTSYRPIGVEGRVTSPKKDDTRLHVDAFPSSPVQNQRILRIFSNVNPHGKSRVWHTGEAFKAVAERFLPNIRRPIVFSHSLLNTLNITKTRRTLYDHYMLNIHDTMKLDKTYQANVKKTKLELPPGSTWIVYTDHVSHAALAGQYLFEQTFYLPFDAMLDPEKSPQRILEKMKGETLL